MSIPTDTIPEGSCPFCGAVEWTFHKENCLWYKAKRVAYLEGRIQRIETENEQLKMENATLREAIAEDNVSVSVGGLAVEIKQVTGKENE